MYKMLSWNKTLSKLLNDDDEQNIIVSIKSVI